MYYLPNHTMKWFSQWYFINGKDYAFTEARVNFSYLKRQL